MGVVDAVFIAVYSVMAAAFSYWVHRRGLIGAFEDLKAGMRRVVEGPTPREGRPDPWAITYPLGLLGRIEDLDYPIEDVVAEIEALEEGRAYRAPHPREGWTEKERMAGRRLPNGGRPIETPVVEQAPAWPTDAAPPAITITPVVPIVADYLGGEAVNLPTMREQFDLLGGPYAGRTVVVLNRPRVIVLQGVPYRAITDPDGGAFLGGYAIDGWDVPCAVCNRHPHRPGGTVLDPADHQYRPSQEYLRRRREGTA